MAHFDEKALDELVMGKMRRTAAPEKQDRATLLKTISTKLQQAGKIKPRQDKF